MFSPCVQVTTDLSAEFERCNLYAAVMGPMGHGKGTTIKRMIPLIYGLDPTGKKDYFVQNLPNCLSTAVPQSGQGLIQDNVPTTDIDSTQYKCYVLEEAREMIGMAEQPGSTLYTVLSNYWETDKKKTVVKLSKKEKSSEVWSSARLSVLMGVTLASIDKFRETFHCGSKAGMSSQNSIEHGMKRRTIWSFDDQAEYSATWTRHNCNAPEPLGTDTRRVHVKAEVGEWLDWWMKFWKGTLTEEQAPALDGMNEILFRAAVVSAAMQGDTTLTWDCFLAAALCDWQMYLRMRLKPSEAKTIEGEIVMHLEHWIRKLTEEGETTKLGYVRVSGKFGLRARAKTKRWGSATTTCPIQSMWSGSANV
jgi:hypothetical protein